MASKFGLIFLKSTNIMIKLTINTQNNRLMAFLFWIVVLTRAILNALIPLMDKTEARYAEIARIMAETQNWIILQIDYGIPFWAKPPLSSWSSALSISLFEDSAFFVRLPYLIVCVLIGLWIGRFIKKYNHSHYFPGIILLCIPEFYIHAGVVSTDVFLMLSTTVTMLSFWKMMKEKSVYYWSYLFFIGLGLGLLAKGPIVGLLTLPSIFLWCLLQKKLISAIKKIPWFSGIFLMLIIALPWYVLVEIKTPGFINYFIVGEHFNRFFNSEWVGDKYGFPKQQPFGIVWGFLISFCLPWSVLLIRDFWKKIKTIKNDSWGLYLWFWILWTPLFFTTSTSLIHPYILPITIPIALWIVHVWKDTKNQQLFLKISLGIPLMILLIYSSGITAPIFKNNTDKYLIIQSKDKPVYALNKKTYSSQFYSKGKIIVIDSLGLKELIDNEVLFSVVIDHKFWHSLGPEIKKSLQIKAAHNKRAVYRSY